MSAQVPFPSVCCPVHDSSSVVIVLGHRCCVWGDTQDALSPAQQILQAVSYIPLRRVLHGGRQWICPSDEVVTCVEPPRLQRTWWTRNEQQGWKSLRSRVQTSGCSLVQPIGPCIVPQLHQHQPFVWKFTNNIPVVAPLAPRHHLNEVIPFLFPLPFPTWLCQDWIWLQLLRRDFAAQLKPL